MITRAVATADRPPTERRRGFLVVLAVAVFFVGASEFMLAAMLGPLATAFGTSAAGASWLVSSYACSYAIAAPVFGFVSDHVDRTRLLLVALLLFAVDGAGIALAPSLDVAIVLRIFGGMASAVLIPSAFALVAEVVDRDRQAKAMGSVMLGMTAGIVAGPAAAGVLTDALGWQAPFLVTSIGCLTTFAIGASITPRSVSLPQRKEKTRPEWLRKPLVWRPLLAKGAWNGTGVSAFLLSGELLRRRYGFDATGVGLSVTAFGLGLGIGNLSAGPLRRTLGREENILVLTTLVLAAAITTFVLAPLPLAASLACLGFWGAALGAGAPASTVVLADRSGIDKGMVLAFVETLNNVAILGTVPLAMVSLLNAGNASVMAILSVGLGAGVILTIWDAVDAPRRCQRRAKVKCTS